jgi:hypothetical protein
MEGKRRGNLSRRWFDLAVAWRTIAQYALALLKPLSVRFTVTEMVVRIYDSV